MCALARSGALMVVVQFADAVIGARISDRFKTVGPGVTAFLDLGALVSMLL